MTPFARLAISSVNQSAFSESGANALNLNVQQQTTNSLRTVLGADLTGAIGLANQRQLDLALRLGWQHEYAYTGRPITAAFAGAPSPNFTVYGATPQRDSAIVGFSASTTVADATQIYLRYDGELGSGTDNHALTAGFRLSWYRRHLAAREPLGATHVRWMASHGRIIWPATGRCWRPRRSPSAAVMA